MKNKEYFKIQTVFECSFNYDRIQKWPIKEAISILKTYYTWCKGYYHKNPKAIYLLATTQIYISLPCQ